MQALCHSDVEVSGFGAGQDKLIPISETGKERNVGKQNHVSSEEDKGESEGIGLPIPKEGILFSKNQQSFSEYELFDDLRYDMLSPPMQVSLEEIDEHVLPPSRVEEEVVEVEPKKVKPSPISFSALKLLKNYGNGFKRQREEKLIGPGDGKTSADAGDGRQELSTEDVFRVAGARFIQSSSQIVDIPSIVNHPFDLYSAGFSDEETGDVELAELLLAAAEKVGYRQFENAKMLLRQCGHLSSNEGNPVQRIVHYFSEALEEKIDRETGGITMTNKQSYDMEKVLMSPNSVALACHGGMPFCQVMQFAEIQAIVDSVADANKVHVIDFGIKFGVQWTALMQALVARSESPIQLLTITAVGRTSKELIEETGKRLASFAETINLPFSFKIVMVSEMEDVKEELFEIVAEEAVAISAQFVLRTMLSQQHQLESLMRAFRSINPRILMVTEVEANHNSPLFVNRFIEALFYFSAYFDCFEACMERDDPNRTVIERMYFGVGGRNIVAVEGEGRSIRSVKIDVWRAFFRRYGMVETGLSMSSLYQAKLVAGKFACASSCTLDMNGESLIIGWKGTPVHSLSAWKFL